MSWAAAGGASASAQQTRNASAVTSRRSEVGGPRSELRRPTSELRHPTSDIRLPPAPAMPLSLKLIRHPQHDMSLRQEAGRIQRDRKSTRLNSSHVRISYAVFCLKK